MVDSTVGVEYASVGVADEAESNILLIRDETGRNPGLRPEI